MHKTEVEVDKAKEHRRKSDQDRQAEREKEGKREQTRERRRDKAEEAIESARERRMKKRLGQTDIKIQSREEGAKERD